MIIGLMLILLGSLSASDLVGAFQPKLAPHLAKLAPYKGSLGAAGMVAGICLAIRVLFGNAGALALITDVAAAATLVVNGLLTSNGLAAKLLGASGRREEAAQMLRVYENLESRRVAVGLAAMAVGIWYMTANLTGVR